MAIRSKTKRRVFILLAVMVLIVVGGAGVYWYRMGQIEQQQKAIRDNGLAMYADGRYFDAMHELGTYINRTDQPSVEVLYKYAQARREVPEPGNRHTVQTVGILRRILDRDPDHQGAREDLLQLYPDVGYSSEAISLADKVLQQKPDHPPAVLAKARGHMQLQEYEQALSLLDRYTNKLKPLDMSAYELLFQTLKELDTQPAEANEQILKRARALLEDHQGDPRAQWVMAYAHAYAQHRNESLEWAKNAADHKDLRPEIALRLVQLMNRLAAFDESMALLRRMGQTSDHPELQRMLARRLWQSGRKQALLDRFAPAAATTQAMKGRESEVLALVALTHLTRGEREEAKAIVQTLKNRKTDDLAQAWTTAFNKVLLVEGQTAGQRIEHLKAVLERAPSHPYFLSFLARAQQADDRIDPALSSWKAAADAAPSWPLPLIEASQLLLNNGREQEAAALARRVLTRRRRGSARAAVMLAEAWAAGLESSGSQVTTDQLSALVDRIQQGLPGETRTLPIQVRLAAAAGRKQQARQRIQAVLSEPESLPQPLLLQLSEISQQYDLGMAEACLNAVRQVYGTTPATMLGQAMSLARQGKPDAGLKQIRQARAMAVQRAGSDQKAAVRVPWLLAEASYLEKLGRMGAALEPWKQLAELRAQDPSMLRRLLKANAVWTDKTFARRTIDQLKEQVGESGHGWRLPEARWLLNFDGSDDAARRASTLLNQLTDTLRDSAQVRRALARCYQQLGNANAAVSQLEVARRLADDPTPVDLQLAAYQLSQGNTQAGMSALENALTDKDLTPAQRRKAAALLAAHDRVGRAIEVLQALHPDTQAPADLMLARLYVRQGNSQRVRAMAAKLLESPTPRTVQFVAGFHAQQGRPEQARAALAKLDSMDVPAAQKALIRGSIQAQYLDRQEGIRLIRRGLDQAPDNPGGHRLLIATLLQAGQYQDATQAVKTAAQACPDSEVLQYLNEHWAVTRVADQAAIGMALVREMVRSSENRDAARQALAVLSEAQKAETLSLAQLKQLRDLASANQQFLTLQTVVAQLHLAAAQPKEAARIAQRTMQLYPQAAGPPQLAAKAYAASGDWQQALSAAQAWRQRTQSSAAPADVMIARAQMQMGRPSQAASTLQPHLEQARQNPGEHVQLILRYARAQIAAGRVEQAASLLGPLTEQSPAWRIRWMQLADAFDNAQPAGDWLGRVTPRLTGEDARPRLQLAQSWYRLADRFGRSRFNQRARQTLKPLLQQPNPPALAYQLLGMMHESGDRPSKAETAYRRALEIDPDQPIAANNLAMVLLDQNGRLSDAETFARRAVELAPNQAPFQDTLAQVLARQGRPADAAQAQAKAVANAPQRVDYRAQLAHYHVQAGQYEQAQAQLNKINSGLSSPSALSDLSESTRQRLQSVREALSRGTAAAG